MRFSVPFGRLAALALVPALLVGCGNDAASSEAVPAQQQAQQTPPADGEEMFDISGIGFDLGDVETAVVQVVEFSDFGCVHCANFHIESFPQLYEEFVASGQVAWKYIPITIAGFPNADEAAVAGHCAMEQDRFAPVRDWLYEHRETWMASDDPNALFMDQADEAGLDAAAFESCLIESEGPRAQVAEASQIAMELGVRGTPTFVVQGFPVQGAPPLDQFQEALRQLVAEAEGQEG
jgi:protein-disulfide isomerase